MPRTHHTTTAVTPPLVCHPVWAECENCERYAPLHPSTQLCGACTFGSVADFHCFEEPWIEGEGRCEHCGCTDDHACEGGCSWDEAAAASGHWLCSACVRAAAIHPTRGRRDA